MNFSAIGDSGGTEDDLLRADSLQRRNPALAERNVQARALGDVCVPRVSVSFEDLHRVPPAAQIRGEHAASQSGTDDDERIALRHESLPPTFDHPTRGEGK